MEGKPWGKTEQVLSSICCYKIILQAIIHHAQPKGNMSRKFASPPLKSNGSLQRWLFIVSQPHVCADDEELYDLRAFKGKCLRFSIFCDIKLPQEAN